MVSVIIPAYNEEGYLDATIRSVRASSVAHEIIVVCNGCTDKTEKIARALADKVIVLKERGVSRARNAGAHSAKYDMLVFLDADTRVSKDVLKEIKECGSFGTARAGSDSGKIKDEVYFFLKYVTQFCYSSAGLIFCSKGIFEKVRGFNEHISKAEDGKFLRNARKFGQFYVVHAPVFTSTRRYEKKGYIGTIFFWIREYLFPSKEEYEAVR